MSSEASLAIEWSDAERLGELLAIVQRLRGQIRKVEEGINDSGSIMVGVGGVTLSLTGDDRDACAAIMLKRLRALLDLAVRDLARGGVSITDVPSGEPAS